MEGVGLGKDADELREATHVQDDFPSMNAYSSARFIERRTGACRKDPRIDVVQMSISVQYSKQR
jgi:hypothetical protein